MNTGDVIRIRHQDAIIPLRSGEDGLELDVEADADNFITGTVVWREGYQVRLELEDGTIESGDIHDLINFRGLREI